MIKFIAKWNGKFIEDGGCYASDEWKAFSRQFKSAIRREGKKHGYEIAGKNPFGQNHYFVSGFVKKGDQTYYISYDYTRGLMVDLTNRSWAGPILWRRAEDENDYRGGQNHFCPLDRLFAEIEQDITIRQAA